MEALSFHSRRRGTERESGMWTMMESGMLSFGSGTACDGTEMRNVESESGRPRSTVPRNGPSGKQGGKHRETEYSAFHCHFVVFVSLAHRGHQPPAWGRCGALGLAAQRGLKVQSRGV